MLARQADQRMGSNPDVLRDLRESAASSRLRPPRSSQIQIIAGVADNLVSHRLLIPRTPAAWIASPPLTCSWCSRVRCLRAPSSPTDYGISIYCSISTDTSPSSSHKAGRDPQRPRVSCVVAQAGSARESASVVDSDHDEAVAEFVHDGESSPVQEAPVRSLPPGAKPLMVWCRRRTRCELPEEYRACRVSSIVAALIPRWRPCLAIRYRWLQAECRHVVGGQSIGECTLLRRVKTMSQ